MFGLTGHGNRAANEGMLPSHHMQRTKRGRTLTGRTESVEGTCIYDWSVSRRV